MTDRPHDKQGAPSRSTHDGFFRWLLSDSGRCLEIIRLALDPVLFGIFKWSTLRREDCSNLFFGGRKRTVDTLYSVEVAGFGGEGQNPDP